MATTATITPTSASVDPGTPVSFTLTVLNDTLLVESFELAPVGQVAAWATVEPSTLTIYPGKSETATVTVLAPRSPESMIGEVALGVRARAVEQPDAMAVAETELTVLPFAQTEAELTPRIARGRGRHRVRVAVDNRGNTQLIASIAATSSDRLGLSTPSPEVAVDPGHTEFVDIDLRPVAWVWRGDPVTHQYSVSVVPEAPPPATDAAWAAALGTGAGTPGTATATAIATATEVEPIVLPGSYVQERVFPKWLWKLLLALLLLLLLLLALWFLLLKPAIESAARNAVEEPLAQANDKSDAAAQQADSAAEKANQALEAVGETPAPVVPVSTTTSSDVDLRFELVDPAGGAADESDRWEVPPNSVLRITDILVSNPFGDAGTITLENQDVLAPIFTSGLENFRDLDFHFVTPVQLGDGDQLFASMTCAAASGAGPNPGQCTASVLVTAQVVTTTG
ncbi:COG1470 family protein [Agromyces humi]|uniref:COG1470 family protein n=1 Tax=Agromyces humi TaxID=1766800 RepID=UPI001358A906|nr:hypothetical protein [Agromyces humi]